MKFEDWRGSTSYGLGLAVAWLCLPLALEAAESPYELLPPEDPLSPEDSMAAFEIDGPYRLELVAAEPLVVDPVELVFDERGRMFVAEMRDYPLGPDEGEKPLSRIRILEDTDGDRVMDRSSIWADELDHVQGIIIVNGGILATTWNAVTFLKDTDGDDVADLRQVLYESGEPGHSQAIVSSPRWGPGQKIYLNNGLNTQSIVDAQRDREYRITGSGIRLNPYDDWSLEITAGKGQFGASFDDLGNHFYTTNRNPIIMTALPREAIYRNPFSGLTSGQTDVYPSASTIYPAAITLTASEVHAGTYTAACGTHVYRGDAIPELRGDALVCDPTGQLVSRHRLASKGGVYAATAVRSRPQIEFIRSRDPWTRPVNLTTGPDGALYLCDIYRRFIDHPRFLPDSYSERFDMREGSNRGRIYRLVPAADRRSQSSRSLSIGEREAWPALLSHDNQWHRTTASRLIRESSEFPLEKLETIVRDGQVELGQVAAFNLLASKSALSSELLSLSLEPAADALAKAALDYCIENPDTVHAQRSRILALARHSNPRIAYLALVALGYLEGMDVIQTLARKLAESPDDYWLQSAVLSHQNNVAPEVLRSLLESEERGSVTPSLAARFAEAAAREADPARLSAILKVLGDPLPASLKFAILDGVDIGLRFQQTHPRIDSLRSLLASPSESILFPERAVGETYEAIATTAMDTGANVPDRLSAIALIRVLPSDEALKSFSELIRFDQAASTQKAAMGVASHLPRKRVAQLLFDRWNELGSSAQTAALVFLNTEDGTRQTLLEKMRDGAIPKSLLDPMSRWRYLRSKNETINQLAHELFDQSSDDRQAIVSSYYDSVSKKQGSVDRGRAHFLSNCSACHVYENEGESVGPDITDVRNKPMAGLLTDILDPNRLVDTRYGSYLVTTVDGRSLMGMIAEENEIGITVLAPGIKETIPFDQIQSKQATGLSLMPPGMETILDPEGMADLIAYLTN